MKTLIKLLLLPFKIIDDGLEFLIFKVLFHRRLWWLTLPLAIGGSIWAYQAWRDRAGAGPARPSPAPSAGPTASPTAGVPRPVAPSRTPAPPVTAPASGGPGLAESLTEGRSPSPSSSRSPAPSPRPAATASSRAPTVRPAPSVSTVDPAPSPGPTAGGSPPPSPVPPTPEPPSGAERLALEALGRLKSAGPTAFTSSSLALVVGLSRIGALPAVKNGLDALSREGSGPARQRAVVGAILAGDAAAAARLTEAMDPELAAAHLDSAEVVRLQTAILKHAPSSVKRELLEAFAGSWRPVPQELGPTIVALLTSREGRATVESAARAAARITDRSLASLLETVIAKFSGEERACVVRALAAMRSDRAKDEATGGLASRVNAVRAHSLHALVELGELDAAATAAAEAVLEPDFVVRHAAARALTELGDTRGVEALTTDLASPLDLVRRSALVVVALLGERRQGTTVKELVGTKTVPTAAKLALIRILASSPSPAATPTIQSLLGHKKESIRLLVYESLGPEQVKLLKPVLLDRLQKEASAAARMALASTLEPVAPEARPVLGQLFASSPALRPVLWRILARVDRDKLCAAVGALGPPDSALDYALAARLVCAAGQR